MIVTFAETVILKLSTW